MTPEQERRFFNTRRSIVVAAFVVPTVISACMLFACLWLYGNGQPVPAELATSATAATTFVFSSLPSWVRDFLADDT